MSPKHWLAAYGEKIPCEIDPDVHGSVLELLEAAMRRYADKPAFRCFGQTLTYADTDRLSRNFAAYLRGRLGVKKGDRIAVMLPNIPAFPLAMLGIVRAGAVQVNVNPLYTPRELEHQLDDAGVETIVIFSGVSATLAEIINKTAVKHVITASPGDGTGAKLPGPAVDPRLADTISFADALQQGADLKFTPVRLSGDDLLFLQYTGGTTGLSKGAALLHRNLVANTEQFKAFVQPHVRRSGRGGRGHGAAALSRVCLDGELHQLLLARRRELARSQSARHGWFRRHLARSALHRVHRREYVVRRTGDASEDRRGRFHDLARRDRWWRLRASGHLGEMESADRRRHPGRLWPVGNIAHPHAQPD